MEFAAGVLERSFTVRTKISPKLLHYHYYFIIICKLFVGRELFIGGAVLKSTNHYNSNLLFN